MGLSSVVLAVVSTGICAGMNSAGYMRVPRAEHVPQHGRLLELTGPNGERLLARGWVTIVFTVEGGTSCHSGGLSAYHPLAPARPNWTSGTACGCTHLVGKSLTYGR